MTSVMKKLVLVLAVSVFVLCLAAGAAGEEAWRWEPQEDGTVRITGYEGEAAETLTLPRTLDGKPVTGVADGALAGAEGLKAVVVPQRIRGIGADAFGGKAVEIRGWNGSYARSWAEEHHAAFRCLSVYDLLPEVVDLTGVEIRFANGRAELSAVDAVSLTEGCLAVLSGEEDVSQLRAYRITGLRAEGDRVTAAAEQVEGIEAVRSYHLELHDVVLSGNGKRGGSVFDGAYDGKDVVTTKYDIPHVGTMTVTATSRSTLNGRYDYEVSALPDGCFEVDTDIVIKATLSGGMNVDNVASGVNKMVKALGSRPLEPSNLHPCRLGEITFVDTKLFKVSSSAQLTGSVSLIGNMEYKIHKHKVIYVQHGVVSTAREEVFYDENPDFRVCGAAKFGVSSSIRVDLLLGSYISFDNSAAVQIKIDPAHQYDPEIECFDGKVSFTSGYSIHGALALKPKVGEHKSNISYTFKEFSLRYGPQLNIKMDMLNFHVEFRKNPPPGEPMLKFIFRPGDPNLCSVLPEDQYTVRFHTGTHQEIENAYAKTGGKAARPDDPKAPANILFLGWGTDPEGTELFDFDAPLPGPGEGETGPTTIDLWALWSKPYNVLTIDLKIEGLEPERRYALPGSLISRPPDPLRMDNRFEGFYATLATDPANTGALWNFATDTMPECDMTLWAGWTPAPGYNPFDDKIARIENDETIAEQTLRDLTIILHPSTAMQGLGAYSRHDNWRVLNQLFEVDGYNGDASVVVIPDRISGTPVVWVDGTNWANKETLQGLVLPSTVEYISGFSDCPNLQYVVFRDSLDTYAGAMDTDLYFEGCETIADGCFKNCPRLSYVRFPKYLHSIGSDAFAGCGFMELNLGEIPVNIKSGAFQKNPNLVSVVLPPTQEWLNEMVFAYCPKLKIINLENVKAYDYGCLACTGFEDLLIPDAYHMKDDIVTGCRELRSLTVRFNENAAGNNSARIGDLPALTELRTDNCILKPENCPALERYAVNGFDVDRNANRNGKGGFYYSLQDLPALRELLFTDCANFRSLGVRDMPELTFLFFDGYLWNDGLTVPAYLTLSNLPKLKTFDAPKTAASIIELNVSGVGLEELDLSRWYLYSAWIEDMPGLETLRMPTLQQALNEGWSMTVKSCPKLGGLDVPDGLTALSGAVSGNAALTRVTLPDSLETLTWIFRDNPALREVRLPARAGLTLPDGCFSGCASLTELTIPAEWGSVDVTAENGRGFLYGSSVSCLNVPDGVAVLNAGAEPAGELFVVETPEGSAAWNALEGTGWVLRREGAGERAVRFRAAGETGVLQGMIHDSVLKTDESGRNLIVEAVPGQELRLPVPVLPDGYGTAAADTAGRPVTDRMTMPDADFTVTVTVGKTAEYTYVLTEGGVRLTSLAGQTGDTLRIPDYADGYPVVEVDPAVLTQSGYTEIVLPSTLRTVRGEDFTGCESLRALYGKGESWTTEGGIAYRTDGNGLPDALLLVPQAYQGGIALPDTVASVAGYAVYNATGLTGLETAGLETIAEHAVTGLNSLMQLDFPASLSRIGADNFNGSPLERVTFGADLNVAFETFGISGGPAFYGPVDAPLLLNWAAAGGRSYNMYALTLCDGGKEISLTYQAGKPMSEWIPEGGADRAFLGWAEDASAPDPTLTAVMPAADTRLEAVWRNLFTVTGGTLTAVDDLAGRNVTVPYGVRVIAAGALTRDVDSLTIPCTVETIEEGGLAGAGLITGDRGTAAEAWAEAHHIPFAEAVYTLTLETNGGAPAGPLTGVLNAALELPEPVRSQASFAGWYADEALTEPFAFTGMPGYDTTAYAAWNLSPAYSLHYTTVPLADGTLMITGYTGKNPRPVLPAELNGIPVTAVADGAFAGNDVLERIVLPETVRTVGDHAFDGCVSLVEAAFLADRAELGAGVFRGCPALRYVTLPAEQTYLPDSMFENCGGLFSLTLPDTIASIGENALADCPALWKLTLPAGLTDFSPKAVRNTPLKTVAAGAGCAALAGDGTAVWTADGRVLLYVCPGAGAVSVPGTVTEIGEDALRGCRKIREVLLPEGLRVIGAGAFAGSGLTGLVLPSSLTEIGDGAFTGCSGLTSLYIPGTVVTIGERIFGYAQPHILVPGTDCAAWRALSGIYDVTVAEREIPVTGISFPESPVIIYEGETLRLSPELTPADATDRRIIWRYGTDSDSHPVRLTADGEITFLRSGSETIYAETANGLRAAVEVEARSRQRPDGPLTDLKIHTDGIFGYKNAFMGFADGTACMAGDARGRFDLTPSGFSQSEIQSWRVYCPEYPALITAAAFPDFETGPFPGNGERLDFTLRAEAEMKDGTLFTKDFPCRLYRREAPTGELAMPAVMTLYEGDTRLVDGWRDSMFSTPFAADMKYRLVSSDPAVAEAGEDGVITARGAGTAVIRMAGMPRLKTVVTVLPNEIALDVSVTRTQVFLGKTETITAAAAEPGVRITYSSENEEVASVDARGVVTPVSTGRTTILVKAERDGRQVAARTVRIECLSGYTSLDLPGCIETRTLEDGTVVHTADLGSVICLRNAASGPPDASARSVVWESGDESVISIDEYGNATILAAGTATVRGTLLYDGSVSEVTLVCDIWSARVISTDPDTSVSVAPGEETALRMLVEPWDESMTMEFTSSRPGVAAADGSGVIRGIAPGDAKITVSVRNHFGVALTGWDSASWNVHVLRGGECGSISGVPEDIALTAGETAEIFSAADLKPAGSRIRVSADYTADEITLSNPGIVELSGSGGDRTDLSVTGMKPGETDLTVRLYYGEKYTVHITVGLPEVYGEIQGAPATLLKGERAALSAGNLLAPGGAEISWSTTDSAVLKVSDTGVVTAAGTGTARVRMTVTAGNGGSWTAEQAITVCKASSGFAPVNDPVAQESEYYGYFIRLTPASAAEDVQELIRRTTVVSSQNLTYKLAWGDPHNGRADEQTEMLYLLTEDTYEYKHYDRVTLITENGLTPLRCGFDLSFDDGNSLALKDVTLGVGQTYFLPDCIDSWRYGLKPSWTAADEDVAAIGGDGTVTALRAGETVLTATAVRPNGETETASCTLTVKDAAPESIDYDGGRSVTMEENSYRTIYDISVLPEGAFAWAETDDSSVVTAELELSEYGGASLELESHRAGSAVVILRGGSGPELRLNVTVTPRISITNNLPYNTLYLAKGSTFRIRVFISPPADIPVSFSLGHANSVISVDENGLITALETGGSSVLVKVGSSTVRKYVEVYDAPETLNLIPGSLRLAAGGTAEIRALDETGAAVPSYTLVWKSSDEDVATVSSTGTVTGAGGGSAVITASTRDGRVSVSARVSVDGPLGRLVLPAGLTAVGEEAFAGLSGVGTVEIGAGVVSIGAGAFADCADLSAVVIRGTGCLVDPAAFRGCAENLVIYCPKDSATWRSCLAAGLTVAEGGN